jgi:hypothetical protein
MIIPLAAQTMTSVLSSATATVKAGANVNTNFPGTLAVGTSTSGVHDATAVGLVRFDLDSTNSAAAAQANIVVLELTLASPPAAVAGASSPDRAGASAGGCANARPPRR